MESTCLFKGLAVGFVLCAPLGPVGIVCIRRILIDGRRAGFFAILGAAAADALYGFLAGFCLVAFAGLLDQARFWLQVFGGVVLVAVGFRLLAAAPSPVGTRGPARNSSEAFVETATLMLSNPLPILAIGAVLSASPAGRTGMGFIEVQLWTLGIFFGSMSWFPILAGVASLIGPALQWGRLPMVDRLCGAAIFSCGVYLGLAAILTRAM